MCDTNANDSFPHGSNSESSQQRARVPGQEEGVGDGSQSDESIDQTGDSIWGGDGEHLVGDEHEDIVPGESSEYFDDQVEDVVIRTNDKQGGERGEQEGDSVIQKQSTEKEVDSGACWAGDDDWLQEGDFEAVRDPRPDPVPLPTSVMRRIMHWLLYIFNTSMGWVVWIE